jgi:hypothetical protein
LRKLLVLGVLAAALAVTPGASAARSFTDPLSDSVAGPDIHEVRIGQDALDGRLVFWVQLANRPDGLLVGEIVILFLDTDQNPATGDESGADYALLLGRDGSGAVRWGGSGWVPATAASLKTRFVRSALSFRISVAPSDLGAVRSLSFFLVAYDESGFAESTDLAPNESTWSYAVAPAALSLAATGFVLAPAAPVAGQSVSATVRAIRRDTFDPVTTGSVRCTLRAGTRIVAARKSGFSGGAAVCKWTVPRSVKGQRLTGTVAVTYKGAKVTKTFTLRAR